MPFEQDDLIIFTSRDDSEETPKEKKKLPLQPVPKQQMLQAQQKPQELPQAKQAEAQATAPPQKIDVQEPEPEKHAEIETVSFMKFKGVVKPQTQKKESVLLQPGEENLINSAIDSGFSTSDEKTNEKKIEFAHRVKASKMNMRDNHRLAVKMTCSLHPWRRAYGICNYCNRPFCYEDIMEYANNYYCLEDIDKVSLKIRDAELVKYSKLSFLSAVLFLLVAGIFIYYSYVQILALINSIKAVGIAGFLIIITLKQIVLIAETVLMFLSVVATVLITLETRRSFKVSAFVGFVTVALFSYQYINTQQIYLGAIAIMAFVALVSLAYSRVAYEAIPEEAPEAFTARQFNLRKSPGY